MSWARAIVVMLSLPTVLLAVAFGLDTLARDADASEQRATVQSRVSTPEGFARLSVAPGSFSAWLRALPVKPGRPPVFPVRWPQEAEPGRSLCGVLDVDVGTKDLQQCADAVIRLRAQFLFAGTCADEIQFDFTSGDPARWREWRQGYRPKVDGNAVTWSRTAAASKDVASFRGYLETVFMFAGSASLERELLPVVDTEAIELGDVFIEGGFPGHAVIVIDVAENGAGERAFLLAQSYMPAQDIHVLESFEAIRPWYRARSSGKLRTPEWTFRYEDARRFAATSCESRE